MRCLTCGHSMVLTAALAAESGFVHGFEQQTLQCAACGETEHRFVFKPAVAALGAEMPTLASPPDCIRVELPLSSDEIDKPVPSANGIIKPELGTNEIGQVALPTNGRNSAVLGFTGTDQPVSIANEIHKSLLLDRSIQLYAMPANGKSSAGDQAPSEVVRGRTQVNGRAFEARETRSANGNNSSPERWLRAVEKFRSYEADLNRRVDKSRKSKAITTGPLKRSGTGRPRSPQRAVLHPGRFDELWDRPIPDRPNGVPLSVAATALAPLPRSLSLVVIEAPEATRDRRGNKHASKKVLEKLYNTLQRMLPSR